MNDMMTDPFEGLETAPAERPLPEANRATDKQISFMTKLREERDVKGRDPKAMTKREASQEIDRLLSMPKADKAPAKAEAPEGIHYVAEDGDHGTVFKVQRAVHGSGKLYAKRLNTSTGDWEYEGRAPLSRLSEETIMTLADAERFGQLYGMCARCGRTLTDEESIARGIGPVCAGKL